MFSKKRAIQILIGFLLFLIMIDVAVATLVVWINHAFG